MGIIKVELPSTYTYIEGVCNPEHKKYEGRQKISYSQVGSFRDYRGDYIAQKFLNLRLPQGEFALFGNAVGDYINPHAENIENVLSAEDEKILDLFIESLIEEGIYDASSYEDEIIVDLAPFGVDAILQGFSDLKYTDNNKTTLVDFKTLNLDKKASYYGSKLYKQLKIYGYALEERGEEIADTFVVGFGRKGNAIGADGNYRMRLSGEIEKIPNPYDREEAKKALKEVADICVEVSDYFKTYKKYFD